MRSIFALQPNGSLLTMYLDKPRSWEFHRRIIVIFGLSSMKICDENFCISILTMSDALSFLRSKLI